MTTREVHRAVSYLFGNYDHRLFNSYLFDWESDFFAISKSGYCIEVEVKISRQDFKKDFTHKPHKHNLFTRCDQSSVCQRLGGESSRYQYNSETKKHEVVAVSSSIYFVKPADALPNKFFYACPEGLIRPGEVPAYAGLIYVQNTDILKPQYWIVKPAPFIHKEKKCFDSKLLSKYYHRNMEVANLLSYYIRQNNLTDQQEKSLRGILDRLR